MFRIEDSGALSRTTRGAPTPSPGSSPAPVHSSTDEATGPRPKARGKFLYVGAGKLWVRGVTYGTFPPDRHGSDYPARHVVEQDFAHMMVHGVNAVRTYTVPPRWLLDTAGRRGLRVMVSLPWEQHVTFLDDDRRVQSIEERVRAWVRACAGHPAVLCYAIGNEIPAPIVRWHGRRRIERYLERLYWVAKTEDPEGLVTYVNYPTTEYLDLPFLDFLSFNVYLESPDRLDAYLARLHNVAGDRPLLLAEVGLDSRRHGVETQARMLEGQIRTVFASGAAGVFVFAWTDEWHRGGYDIDDWDFGVTTRDRQPKQALAAVRRAFADVPFRRMLPWPRISVVVCTHNGARTIGDCLSGLGGLDYPNFEVIVVDDGSTDGTPAIVEQHGFRLIRTEHRGLSNARNLGLRAAAGEIVAYIDDDAWPDMHWLTYLVSTFLTTSHIGVGGPNIAPEGDGPIADCIANAPGGPSHVLVSDREAEHIPGCNMAFRKSALEAIGGFDAQFWTAGDDVDVCWRLQQQGWTLGFNPGAVVWHHRRGSIRAYWRQQQGYGRAEALLERKWPQKYNAAGHLAWAGRVYAKGFTPMLLWRRRRIYHGTWGSALFQSVQEPAADVFSSLPLIPEWYLVIAVLAAFSMLGFLWRPLLFCVPLLVGAVGSSLAQAVLSAGQARFARTSRSARLKLRGLTALLHLIQPLARLRGRLESGLVPWRRRGAGGLMLPRARRFRVWNDEWQAPSGRLKELEGSLRAAGNMVLRGGDYDSWDLEVRVGTLGAVRVLMAIEEHGGGRQLVRLRAWPRGSTGALGTTLALVGLAIWASVDQAWTAAVLLGAAAGLLAGETGRHCSTAMAALAQGLEYPWAAEARERQLAARRGPA